MLGTAEPTVPIRPAMPRDRRTGEATARAAGLGALAFVGVVIVQNLLRGSAAPANGASPDEVLGYYADHRSLTFVLVATYVASGVGLALFLGGAMRRLVASTRSAWAYTGLVGAVAILTLFSVMVASEQALSLVADSAEPQSGAVAALWALHNSTFTVLLLSIGIALVGLARAGVAAGITPPAFDRLAPIGAALLALATIAGPAIAGGDAMAVLGLGIVGFVVWLAFLATTGLRLVRAEEVRS